jgi:hypothetical protein
VRYINRFTIVGQESEVAADGSVVCSGKRKREWMVELILFSWVGGTALIFNLFYWTKQRA